MNAGDWVWIALGVLLLGVLLLLWPVPSTSPVNEPAAVPTLIEWYEQHPDRSPPPEIAAEIHRPNPDGPTVVPDIVVYPETWKSPTLEQARRASAYGRSMKDSDWYDVLAPWTINEQGVRTNPGGYGPLATIQTPLQRIVETSWREARKYNPPLTDDFLTFNMYSPTHSFNEVRGTNVLNVSVHLPGYSSDSHNGYHAVLLQGRLVLQPTFQSGSSIVSAQWPEYPAYITLLYYHFDVTTLDPSTPFILKIIPPAGGEITFPVNVAQLGAGGVQ